MKTGDILLCSGTGPLSKLIIKYNKVVMYIKGPAAEISHVAMVGPADTLVFEATTLNWNGKKGVQINNLAEWDYHYPGRIWIRRQNNNVTDGMRKLMVKKMLELEGTPYENGIPGALELLLAGFKIPWLSNSVAQSLRTRTCLHCSEADGEVLKVAGVFPGYARTNKLPPCMWWDSSLLNFFYDKPEVLKG